MSFFPFLIGVSASVGYSFAILERISDRRLISFHRSDFDEFLTKNLYKAKLRQLITAEQKEQFSESSFEEGTRKIINEGIVKNIYSGVSRVSIFADTQIGLVKGKINEIVSGLGK